MNKKKPHKKSRKQTPSRKPTLVFSILVLIGFFALFFGFVRLFHLTSTVHVLGTQSVLPASKENEEESRHQKEREEEDEITSKKTRSEISEKHIEVEEETLVDCIGPDGKHFTTTYISCYKLNKSWENKDFSFTPLSKSQKTSESKKKITEKEKEEREVETSIQKKHIEQEKHIEEEKEAKKDQKWQEEMADDGIINSQSELQKEMEQWEEDENKVSIETSEENTAFIEHKNTKAESAFPVTVNEETNELTITTPSGTKTVTVLPDKAVENILKAHLLTNIETELSSESGDFTQKLMLTEMNNEAVFAVKGVSEKKVLGIIPVAFAKTVYVSASDGTVVKADQSILNTLLEKISF